MYVVALGLDLVIVFFALEMHEIELVYKTQILQKLDGAIYRGAVDIRFRPSGEFEQGTGIEMSLCCLNDLDQRTALRGQTDTFGDQLFE